MKLHHQCVTPKWRVSPLSAALVLVLALPNLASAQQQEGFTSIIDVQVARDDNIFRTQEQLSDTITTLAPSVEFKELYTKYQIAAKYQGNYALYADNSGLNYADHTASLLTRIAHTGKFSSEISVAYSDKIEQPGSTNAVTNLADEFNQVSTGRLGLKGAYGTSQSIGQLVLAYAKDSRDYGNNDQSFRDYQTDTLTSTFFYRVAPKTRLLLEASNAELDYQNAAIFDFSSTQRLYLAGVEWEATSKTTGVLKVGYQDLDFDDPLLTDISGLSYFLNMQWQPSSYSTVNISANKTTRESAEQTIGSYEAKDYELRVAHKFTPRSEFSAQYKLRDEDFQGSTGRNDTYRWLGAKFSYSAKHWLDTYIEVETSKRESTQEIYRFEATVLTVGVTATFD